MRNYLLIGQVGMASPWAEQVRSYLDTAVNLKVTGPAAKAAQEELLNNIVQSIQLASRQLDVEANLEIKELEVPEIKGGKLRFCITLIAQVLSDQGFSPKSMCKVYGYCDVYCSLLSTLHN
jgi:hypothetical protein